MPKENMTFVDFLASQKMLINKNFSIIRRLLSSYEKPNGILFNSSSSNLTMKKLIDLRQYQKALDLFDKQSEKSTGIDINMALKACTNLHDYQRGKKIHRQLSSNSLNNPFIQTSLVYFYIQLVIFQYEYNID